MNDKEKIIKAVFAAVDEINSVLLNHDPIEKISEAVLLGEEGKLDSLGMVSLITAVEQKVEEVFGVSITLADERALSQKDSPFRSIGALTDYIAELVKKG